MLILLYGLDDLSSNDGQTV
jgi:hypothetical protein